MYSGTSCEMAAFFSNYQQDSANTRSPYLCRTSPRGQSRLPPRPQERLGPKIRKNAPPGLFSRPEGSVRLVDNVVDKLGGAQRIYQATLLKTLRIERVEKEASQRPAHPIHDG